MDQAARARATGLSVKTITTHTTAATLSPTRDSHRATTGLRAAAQASAEVRQAQVLRQGRQAVAEAAASAEAAAAVAAE